MKNRKAMSMPMEIIIAIVVLVVIALAVIMLTNGGIIKFGTDTTDTGGSAAGGLKCQAEKTAYCAKNPSSGTCSSQDCPSCGTSVSCPRSASTPSTPAPPTYTPPPLTTTPPISQGSPPIKCTPINPC